MNAVQLVPKPPLRTRKVTVEKDFYTLTGELSVDGMFYYDSSNGQWDYPVFKLLPETLVVKERSEIREDAKEKESMIDTSEIHRNDAKSFAYIEEQLITKIFDDEGFHD